MWDEPRGQWSRPPAFGDGAAGLVSTADDLLAFSRMLLAGGAGLLPADERSRDVQRPAHRRAEGARGTWAGGFFARKSWGYCQAVYDGGAFGWNGGLGTSWVVDPAHDLTVIVLTQRLFESPELPAVHRDIQSAVYASLGVGG